jgi:dienelactone hydrolase
MGHMIADTRNAIDALSKDDQIDAQRIDLYGFSMGGNLALHTAPLEPRIKGVVAINAFTTMRTDTVDKGTGGMAPKGSFPGVTSLGAPSPCRIAHPQNDAPANAAQRVIDEASTPLLRPRGFPENIHPKIAEPSRTIVAPSSTATA